MMPRQPNFGQNSQKSHKNGQNFSCVQHINAMFGFEMVSVIRKIICDTAIRKEQRGIVMTTNFETKIAINVFQDSVNVITYHGVYVVGQFKEDICDCNGLSDVFITTKFWPE